MAPVNAPSGLTWKVKIVGPAKGWEVQPRRINILEGSTFVVSDLRGDIGLRDDEMSGLFYRDMRHLSRWQIRLNGREPDVLSGDTLDYDEAVFFLVGPTGTIYRNPSPSLVPHPHGGGGMQEQLELVNHGRKPVQLGASLALGAR